MATLTDEQLRTWDHEGYLVPEEPLISPDTVHALQTFLDDVATGRDAAFPPEKIVLQAKYTEQGITSTDLIGEERRLAVRLIETPHENSDVVNGVVHDPHILDLVQDLIGPDIKLYATQVFAKPEGGTAEAWHQDSMSWTFFAPHNHVTIWIALDDATQENGALNYIPGSHRYGYVVREKIPELVSQLEADSVVIPRPAGHAAVHHTLLLHKTGPNTTTAPRRGMAMHFIRSDTRYLGDPSGRHLAPFPLLRGREISGRV